MGYLDYGARMYDAGLGRWMAVDLLSENYPGIGSYVYCINNPLLYRDLLGLDWYISNRGDSREAHKWYDREEDAIAAYGAGNYINLGRNMLGEVVVKSSGVTWFSLGLQSPRSTTDMDWSRFEERALATARSLEAFHDRLNREWELDIARTKRMLEFTGNTVNFMDFTTGLIRIGMGGVESVSNALLMQTNRVYAALRKGSKMLGRANNIIFWGTTAIETYELSQGKISPGRYAYHLGGGLLTIGVSTKVGFACGGPWGVVAGFGVGGIFYSGEVMYDRSKKLYDAGYQHMNSFVNSVRTGAFMYGY